ncbi:SDR family oxidoreductase [Aurantiacibacter gangjinensis]|uniref:Oxidoreductase n=1 Tax=Aurantiacibacter gangjinensis TaxID=502682 RepID=A0A0G9MUX7_9SPHN|nr:SDR family oxidoreductase [Aurantiacibacter gangjinensis]APE28987.1 3-oxoacyl-[acyl-carrier protein] reductase [Aurantiacibacter gangjinensis]KLE33098.1 oxidoreductase [Aurantiacibacter gangjinensis]
MNRFDGKRILITGGTSGFGLEAAKMIVEEGGEVAVTGTSQDHLDEAGRSLPKGSLVLRNDASDPEAAKDLAAKVKDQMDGLDGLWLNAGYGKFAEPSENDAEMFDHMMNVNVRGPVLQMAALMDEVKDGGSVLFTSSVAPYLGQPQGAVYAATKAADLALSRSYARALAPRNVRVNAVAPGPIDTNFFEGMGLDEDEKEDMIDRIKSSVALGRMGEAKEVAQVALFLLSDHASYVTGSEYFVDGGMTMR